MRPVGLLRLAALLVIGSIPYPSKAQTDTELSARLGVSESLIREIRIRRSLSPSEIEQLSVEQVARHARRLEYGNIQSLRQQQWRLGLVDENGGVPTAAIGRALQDFQRSGLRLRITRGNIAGIPVGAVAPFTDFTIQRAGAGPDRWTAIGPNNVGGRTRSIVIHPTAPNRIWVGSVGGGIWYTEEGGNKWRPVDDRMANLAISTLAMDPTNSRVIYAGTGEAFSYPPILGAGVFWTTDGIKWKVISSTIDENAGKNYEFVNRIAVSANGKVVLAATTSGLFRSEDASRKGPSCITSRPSWVWRHGSAGRLYWIGSGYS